MAGSWYSAHQALGIAMVFALLDVFVVMMGLMWDGKFFTIDNVVHWFDFNNYDFRRNPVDFLVSLNSSSKCFTTTIAGSCAHSDKHPYGGCRRGVLQPPTWPRNDGQIQ